VVYRNVGISDPLDSAAINRRERQEKNGDAKRLHFANTLFDDKIVDRDRQDVSKPKDGNAR